MQTYQFLPEDVNALFSQNLILPAGTQKINEYEYFVKLNGSPADVGEFNDLPLKNNRGRVSYIRDVAHARDGSAPQTNIVDSMASEPL